MKKYFQLVTVPEGIDLSYATERFNDEHVSLTALTNTPTCFLCSPEVRRINRCNTEGDDCYRCMLSMRHYSSGVGLYQDTKRKLFTEYAGMHGYAITRKGYENNISAKNPAINVRKMEE